MIPFAHASEHAHAVEIGHDEIENEQIDRRPVGASRRSQRRLAALDRFDVDSRSGGSWLRAGGAGRDRRRRSGWSLSLHSFATVAAPETDALSLSRICDNTVKAVLTAPPSSGSVRAETRQYWQWPCRATSRNFRGSAPADSMVAPSHPASRRSSCRDAPPPSATALGRPAATGGSTTSIPGWIAGLSAPISPAPRTSASAFAETYRGKLAGLLAERPGRRERLCEAVRALRGARRPDRPLMSYAGLVYAGDTSDPARAKFYGDAQEQDDRGLDELLFFQLELNRLDDAALEAAMQRPPLAHYRPWLEDIRKEKPYQLDDDIEQLFHEKSVTGRAAWNRLFDETIAAPALQGRRRRADARADAQSACRTDEEVRARRPRRSRETLRPICVPSPSSPTRSPRTRRFPTAGAASRMSPIRAICPTGSSARWSMRWSAAVQAAYPRLSHRYYALKAQMVRQASSSTTGTATRRCPTSPPRTYTWDDARDTVLAAYGDFSPRMAGIARTLLRRALDRCAGAARQGARRLRASDRAVGASLRAAQLPGQAARRDDARA